MTKTKTKFPPLTEEEKEGCLKHWADCYINLVGGDPHGQFAQRMGVERNEGKRIAFCWSYYQKSHWFLAERRERKVRAQLVLQIQKLMKEKGVKLSIYQILDTAEMLAEGKINHFEKGNK